MGDISTHFSRHELDCHDGTPVPAELMTNVHRLVFGVLEPIRDELVHRVDVLSGYRTPAHNASVGGAPDSRHLYGDAADIQCIGFNPDGSKLWQIVRHLWDTGHLPALGGLGRYDNRVHVDARPHEPGVLAEWDARTTEAGG